jgi:glyoxylase-like metal-dependent hydrolase (beta-lactamase superfamily II)
LQVHTIDLLHRGFAGRIAAYLVVGPGGPVLIETGPSSCHQTLVKALAGYGFEPRTVKHVFVTHIHLDHAGGAGWWARQGSTIHVHGKGAPHLVDPSRLIDSAARLYGKHMDELWGDIPSTPAERVRIVEDGEIIRAAGLDIEPVATPGHASHHHSYCIDNLAFTGDLAAIVIPGTDLIEIPTPPPEYDLQLWQESLERIAALELDAIYPTHFGRVDDVSTHLDQVSRLLAEATELVRRSLREGRTKSEIESSFSGWTRDRFISAGATEEQLRNLANFNPPALSLAGILRYWKKKCDLIPSDAT